MSRFSSRKQSSQSHPKTPDQPDPAALTEAFAGASGDVMYSLRTSPTTGFEYVSGSAEGLTGWSPAELLASSDAVTMLVPDSERPAFRRLTDAEPGVPVAAELRLRRRDDSTVATQHRGRVQVRPDGTVVLQAVARDVTEAARARTQLLAATQEHRTIVDNIDDVVFTSTPSGLCRYVSPSVANLLGWWPQDLVGRQVADLWHAEDLAEVQAVRLTRDMGRGRRVRGRMRCKDGTYKWVESHLRSLTSSGDGDEELEIAVIRDIDSQVRTENALAESDERFRLAMLAAPIGVAVLDHDRRFLEVNDALCQLLGRERKWLLAHSMQDVMSAADARDDLRMREGLLRSRADHAMDERRMIRSDEQTVWVYHSVAVVRDAKGTPRYFVSQMQDVTHARRVSSELRFLASHDRLTGLLDRHSFEDGLSRAVLQAAGKRTQLAVLHCDVHDMAGINATVGRPAGDEVLRRIAERITASIRRGDTAFRVGGDEFVIVLEGIQSLEEADQVAGHIAAAAAAPIAFGRENITPRIRLDAVLVDDTSSIEEILDGTRESMRDAG